MINNSQEIHPLTLKVKHINVNSIFKKSNLNKSSDKLSQEIINNLTQGAEIILMADTRVREAESNMLTNSFSNHHVINTPLPDTHTKRGGTTIIISKDICSNIIIRKQHYGAGTEGIRAQAITFKHTKTNKIINLASFYACPSNERKLESITEIFSFLLQYLHNYPSDYTILAGDLNHQLDTKDRTTKYINKFLSAFNLADAYRYKYSNANTHSGYTFGAGKLKCKYSRIDYIFVSQTLLRGEYDIKITPGPIYRSDHSGLHLITNKHKNLATYKKGTCYYDTTVLNDQLLSKIKNKIKTRLSHFLIDIGVTKEKDNLTLNQIDSLMPTELPNIAFINEIIKQTFHKSIGERKAAIEDAKRRRLSKEMEKFNRTFYNKNIPRDMQTVKLRDISNKITQIMANNTKNRRRENYIKKVELGEGLNQYFYNKINQKSRIPTIEELKIGDKMTTEREEIGNEFYKYFKTKFENKSNDGINSEQSYALNDFLEKYDINLGTIDQTTREELNMAINDNTIIDAINQTKSGSAGGPDGVTGKILKLFAQWCPKITTAAFKNYLNQPTKADERIVKNRNIILIKKNNNKKTVEQVRPISLLSIYYKVLSNILHSQIRYALEKCDFFGGNILAYRKNINSLEGIRIIKDAMENAEINDKNLILLQIDLKSAFDTMSRPLLYSILKKIGIPQIIIEKLKKQLENNTANILLNREIIGEINIETGSGQGDILSTIIFNIIINLLSKAFQKLPKYNLIMPTNKIKTKQAIPKRNVYQIDPQLYADDSLFALKNVEDIKTVFTIYKEFAKISKLNISPTKCSIISNKIGRENIMKEINETGILEENVNNNLTFLGHELSFRHNTKVIMADKVLKKLEKVVAKLKHTYLSLIGRANAIQAFMIPLINYYLITDTYTEKELKKCQEVIDKYSTLERNIAAGKTKYYKLEKAGGGSKHILTHITAMQIGFLNKMHHAKTNLSYPIELILELLESNMKELPYFCQWETKVLNKLLNISGFKYWSTITSNMTKVR